MWADLKYALRMLAKTPAYTAVLVLTLALGIGASTTIFSVVNSVVLKPLPYHQPDRLVRVYTEFLGGMNLRKFWTSEPEYWQLKKACQSCETVAATYRGSVALSGGDRPVQVTAAGATQGLLPTLGVSPMLGRFFDDQEDLPAEHPSVVILGHGVWKRAFGGDETIIGREILLEARPVTVVGVMPPGFDYPNGAEAWVPARLNPASDEWGGHNFDVLVRLKPGVSLGAFRSELATLTATWGKDLGDNEHNIQPDKHPMIAFPLQDEVVGSLAKTLWLLQGAVLFVLLIAIANVTNLLLARAESRSREIAVRHALGATRPRLVRQLVTESLVLGIVGGGLGILVAVWALDATIALIPKSAPRVDEITLDGAALAFALVLTVASSLLFGLAPILHTRKSDVHGALKDGGPRTAGSRTQLRVRRALVVAEIALAVVLVIGCGLMTKSFLRLQHVDLGFEPDHLLTFSVEIPSKVYADDAAVAGYWRRVEERMRALPGVTGATVLAGLPPQRPVVANDLGLPGRTYDPNKEPPWNTDYWQIVGDHAFDTLGARIVAGRGLEPSDVAGAPLVVVINQAFAKKYFPGQDPIGQKVQAAPWRDDKSEQTIVGVVADLKQGGVDRPAGTELFFTVWQMPEIAYESPTQMHIVIRTEGDPAAVAPAALRAVSALDPTIPIDKVRTMDDVLWEAVARPRFLTFLLGSFAVLALVLAGIGIYGVMAYTVAQRTHEIGIRVALGATRKDIFRLVMSRGLMLAAVGLVAALALELTLANALSGPLYGERLRDPLLFIVVALVVVGAGLFASWLPARRATRVEPTVALRAE